MLGGVHGDDDAAVYAELCQAVEEWIRICEQEGEPLPEATAGREYSGRFVLRAGKELHEELAIRAMSVGESLNAYCVNTLRGNRRRMKRQLQARARK